jgi:hypothetical protein
VKVGSADSDDNRNSHESAPGALGKGKNIDPQASIDAEGEEFLRHLGVGVKKKAKKLTKLQQSENALRNAGRADVKVLEELEYIKNRFKDKQQRQQEIVEVHKEKIEISKKKLRQQLEKRNIEHGVAAKNQTDVSSGIVFDFGVVEAHKINEKKTGLPDIEVVNLETEEDRDKEAVNLVLRKYNKPLRTMFNGYCSTAYQAPNMSHKETFEHKQQRSDTIYLPELYSMISDYEMKKNDQ